MSERKILVVATGNPGKVREMAAYLGFENGEWELQLKPEELEVEETGATFMENACLKATEVATATGHWAIADDSGLEVEAIGGAPGVYSARYGATDKDRIDRLLRELGSEENRKARFVCAIAIARPDGVVAVQVEGTCHGEILHTPQGNGGFGYDPIFYVPEIQKTFAEITPEVKRSYSHRGEAFRLLLPHLRELGIIP